MTGGTSGTPLYLSIDNNNTNAIVHSSSGHIITSNEYQHVKWNIGTSSGNYTFPFGVGSTYIPFVFNITSAGVGPGSISSATWYTLNNLDVPDGGYFVCPSENSAIDRFWLIDPENYTANPTADIRFYYSTVELDAIPEALLVAQRGNLTLLPGCPWDSPVGTVNSPLDYLEVTGVSSFSPWTLSNNANPLPIELLSFIADWKSTDYEIVELKWSTASEVNNDYFEVQRSTDGMNFLTLDTVDGSGNSNSMINYSYDDIHPEYNSSSYYRLKQVDFDGNYSYSNIEIVTHSTDSNIIIVFPNPSTDYFSIFSPLFTDNNFTIAIYNMAGQIVHKSNVYANKSVTTNSIDVSDFSSGTYILEISSESNGIIQKKLLINNKIK